MNEGKKEGKNVCWGLLNTIFCPFTTTMAKPPAVDAKRNVEIKKVTGTWNTDIPGIVHVFLNQNKCKWICYDFVRMCRQSMCHTTHRFGYAMSIIASVHYTALHTQEHFVYLIQFSLNFSRFFLHSGWFNVFIVIDIIMWTWFRRNSFYVSSQRKRMRKRWELRLNKRYELIDIRIVDYVHSDCDVCPAGPAWMR